jgi:hypothetical protein
MGFVPALSPAALPPLLSLHVSAFGFLICTASASCPVALSVGHAHAHACELFLLPVLSPHFRGYFTYLLSVPLAT